jgi:hypothetical protein
MPSRRVGNPALDQRKLRFGQFARRVIALDHHAVNQELHLHDSHRRCRHGFDADNIPLQVAAVAWRLIDNHDRRITALREGSRAGERDKPRGDNERERDTEKHLEMVVQPDLPWREIDLAGDCVPLADSCRT